MTKPNDSQGERRHIDNIPQGTKVICNGHAGAIVRQYSGDTYEIRLASGLVATDDFELDEIARRLRELETAIVIRKQKTKGRAE